MDTESYELAVTIGDFSSIKGIPVGVYGNMYLSKLTLQNWEYVRQGYSDDAWFYSKLTSEIQNDESVVLLALSKLEPERVLPYVAPRVISKLLKQAYSVALVRNPLRAFEQFEWLVENFLDKLTPYKEQYVWMHILDTEKEALKEWDKVYCIGLKYPTP